MTLSNEVRSHPDLARFQYWLMSEPALRRVLGMPPANIDTGEASPPKKQAHAAPKPPPLVKRRDPLDAILKAVSQATGINIERIMSEFHRNRPEVRARQLAWLLSRERTKDSYPVMGNHYRRDHTTIIYGVKQARRRVKSDAGFQACYDRAVAILDERGA